MKIVSNHDLPERIGIQDNDEIGRHDMPTTDWQPYIDHRAKQVDSVARPDNPAFAR